MRSPLLALLLAPSLALAIQLDDPVNFQLIQVWSGATFGVPGRLGAAMFSPDGQTLYIVGDSEATTSAVYAMPVLRDPSTQRVIGFGSATLVFSGNPATRGIDAGMELGPAGTLFYTYWPAHIVAERTTVTSTVEVQFNMAATTVPSSVAGLTFSPHLTDPGSSFALLQVSSWLGDGVYDVPLTPIGGGIYQPGIATLFLRLPQQGTGAIQYVPQGMFTGNLMYVNWDFGEVRMVVIDRATGLPIDDVTGIPTLGTTTPRDMRFAYDLGVGPWGLEFDPLTLDFFVMTWNGNPANSIIQFSGPGFANNPPVASDLAITTDRDMPVVITLQAIDPDMDPLTFTASTAPSNGTLTGTTADVLYTPNTGFVGTDQFTFYAHDGRSPSNTATVTITVRDTAPDAGLDDGGGDDGGGADAEPGDGQPGDGQPGDGQPGDGGDDGGGADGGDGGAIDTGSPVDTGTGPGDTGAGADTGAGPPDSGVSAPDAGTKTIGSDCECSAARTTDGAAIGLWWIALAALIRSRIRLSRRPG
jgi:hypothetical protein